MLTPAAIANAVADALGRDDIVLPLTRQRIWELANADRAERRPSHVAAKPKAKTSPGALTGEGEVVLSASPQEVWRRLVDAHELAAIVPGCQDLQQDRPDRYNARVLIGVAGIRGTYDARIELHDRHEGESVRLVGKVSGALGFGSGTGLVTLAPEADGRTKLTYRYEAEVGGKVAAVGQRLLGTVTRVLIAQFFRALERRLARNGGGAPRWYSRLLFWQRRERS
jgi:2-furoyl-CoA dehydrogenase large subunit